LLAPKVIIPLLHAQPPEPIPRFDSAAIERGKAAFIGSRSFCHGSNARGDEKGPDLLRSVMVPDDDEGRELGDFLGHGTCDSLYAFYLQ
jgi:hypothetical protein